MEVWLKNNGWIFNKISLKIFKKTKKLTQRQRDLKNARARIRAAERRSRQGSGTTRKHKSKRMKELIKKGTLGKIDKEAKKGTGIFIGQKNPGRGVGRWDYSDKK